jgi:hypothetical protein
MLALFAATTLSSALLLFWIEPLFAKMVLPMLGGSPAVWNTCLMFFQAMLLAGYLYAHLTSMYLSSRRQSVLHVALLVLAVISLPVAIPHGWTPPESGNVIPWLTALLSIAVGAPFVLLAATAPLVQRWLTDTGHPFAANPYVLYAASNAGSLAGLLGFPILMEPNFRLGEQAYDVERRIWHRSRTRSRVRGKRVEAGGNQRDQTRRHQDDRWRRLANYS